MTGVPQFVAGVVATGGGASVRVFFLVRLRYSYVRGQGLNAGTGRPPVRHHASADRTGDMPPMTNIRLAVALLLAVLVRGQAEAAACDPSAHNNPAFASDKSAEVWCLPAPPVIRPPSKAGCPDTLGKSAKTDDNAIYNDGETSITVSGAVAVDIGTGRTRPLVSHHRTDFNHREAEAHRCD